MSILTKKYTKFDFGWSSAPDPAGGAYSAPPDPLVGLKGSLLLRKGRGRKGGKGRHRRGCSIRPSWVLIRPCIQAVNSKRNLVMFVTFLNNSWKHV